MSGYRTWEQTQLEGDNNELVRLARQLKDDNEKLEAEVAALQKQLQAVGDLYDAAEAGYGWICNFPETDQAVVDAKLKVSKEIGDLLYKDPRLADLRESRNVYTVGK